ncbi:type I-G CRISPR-associated RAMP protein Csb1/Cas7g [Endozoicomonas sp. ALB032]|uniref:type I-G CRISPR-associated RAMP protein Csb1/Cas7g n=1 Tax=Endozoicomonas sp. ALB032 TaxID=3403082 RepID=UPI003BB4D0D3
MSKNKLFDSIDAALMNKASAVRMKLFLEPAGGAEDKVFPPTYKHRSDDKKSEYASEKRISNGKELQCTLLDSVASQANRIEDAILQKMKSGSLGLPDIQITFESINKNISVLELPHRLYDAIVRDSLLNDVPFRQTELGQLITSSDFVNATALFEQHPVTLLLGGWDSHNRNNGLGVRLQRCLTSEINAIGVIGGKRVGGRIDPVAINKDAATIYKAEDTESLWTLDEEEAEKKNQKPVPISSRSNTGDGKPSAIGHGNIPPTVSELGGVTCEQIEQTAVLSLTQIRKMRFPDLDTGELSEERDHICRMVLALLGLHGLALQYDQGYDLRSRCLLIPSDEPVVTIIGKTAKEKESLPLDSKDTLDALNYAVKKLKKVGVRWNAAPVELKASDKLEKLISKSRALSDVEGG